MTAYRYKRIPVGALPSSGQLARAATRSLYIPSRAEIVFCATVGLFLLLLFNINALVGFYADKIIGGGQLARQQFGNDIQSVVNYIDARTGFRLAGFIIWFALGIAAYLFIWLLSNLFINVRNDFIAANYVHPPDFNKQRYWRRVRQAKAQFVLGLVGIIIYVAIAFWQSKRISQAFYQGLTQPPFITHLPGLVLSLVVASLLVYIFVTLAKICRHGWLLIQKGL